MADEAETTIAILNELLEAEGKSLLVRMSEAAPFVSREGASSVEAVSSIAAEQSRHMGALIRGIVELGGMPVPRQPDASTTHLHYLDLAFLVPQVLADARRLIGMYERALERVAPGSASGALVGRLLLGHRAQIGRLERLGLALQGEASP